MDFLTANFWVGVAIAIPFSILANLLTPKVQQWFAKRNVTKSIKRLNILENEYNLILKLSSNSGELQTHLLESVLVIALTTSIFGVFMGLLWAIDFLLPELLPYATPFFVPILLITASILITQECFKALKTLLKVRNFEKYQNEVLNQIDELTDIRK
jgi:hypothetical protein